MNNTIQESQPYPIFNIMDYGAVKDQATPNTCAIQAAIDACSQAGGGTGRDFYFDERGTLVSATDENRLFGARVWVRDLLTLSGDVSANTFLRELEIRIADHPELEGAFTEPGNYRTVAATVVKTEK